MQFREVELQSKTNQFNNNVEHDLDKMHITDGTKQTYNVYEQKDGYYGSQDQQYGEQDKSDTKTSSSLGPKALNVEDGIQIHSIKNEEKSSSVNAYMNLFKGYIGSGILALPFAFSQAGWVLSSIIFLIVAMIVYETMQLLFELVDSFNKEGIDYQFLAKHHFGRKGLISVNFFLIVFQMGCCISYVIFFIKFLENVFDMAGSEKGDNDFIYLLIALAIIIPMSFINNINVFAKVSIVANFMIVLSLFAIFSYNIERIQNLNDEDYNRNLSQTVDFSRIPDMIGVSIYAFEAIGLIFTIRNSVDDPQKQFSSIFRNTNVLMVSLYIIFSVLGVIAYGQEMNEIILFSLPNNQSSVQFFQIIYAFALIMSYPLQLLPCFKIIEANKYIISYIYQGSIVEAQSKEPWKIVMRKMSVRIFITLCICFIAFTIPRFAVFLNIIGAVAGTSLQFILPIIMYLQTFKNEIQLFKKFKLYGFLTIGIIGGLTSLIFSVIELFKSREGENN